MLDLDTIGRRFDEHANTVEAALLSAKATADGIGERISSLEQRIARGGGGGEPAFKTWGESVADDPAFKNFAVAQTGKVRIQVKTTITTGSTSGGPLAPSDRQPGPNLLPRRDVRVRDLLTPGRRGAGRPRAVSGWLNAGAGGRASTGFPVAGGGRVPGQTSSPA